MKKRFLLGCCIAVLIGSGTMTYRQSLSPVSQNEFDILFCIPYPSCKERDGGTQLVPKTAQTAQVSYAAPYWVVAILN